MHGKSRSFFILSRHLPPLLTLIEEGQQLGVPMAMPRRWTAVKHAKELGIDIHRIATVERITKKTVEIYMFKAFQHFRGEYGRLFGT